MRKYNISLIFYLAKRIVFYLFCIFSFSVVLAQNGTEGITISYHPFTLKEEEKFYKDSIPDIIPEYFLLGTLYNSYSLGGPKNFKNEDQIDRYNTDEEPLANYLKDYIQRQFNINASIQRKGENIIICSIDLSKMIGNYFNEEGLLDLELFDSKKKIYSFLLGAYYRDGVKMGKKIYRINKLFDGNLLYSLLQKAGCGKIFYQHVKYKIPSSTLFYFEVPPFLEKYFNTIEQAKEELSNYKERRINPFSSEKASPLKNDRNEMIESFFNSFSE